MIIGYIKGQQLELKSELIVADTIDYLTAKFVFKTADWQGLSKWAHFKKGSTVYDIQLTSDGIQKSDHLNLAEGEWEVYLHGNAFEGGEVVERITTETAKLTVKGTGSLNGEPFPKIPASEAEQIEAQLADHEERIDALEQGGGGGGIPDAPADGKQYARQDHEWTEIIGGGGGGTTDHRQLSNRDAANQHPISAITGLETALNGKGTYTKPIGGIPKSDLASTVQTSLGRADTALQSHQSLAGYATESYVQNYHDSTKQDAISDLATIRSGAALGATALQSVPNTYALKTDLPTKVSDLTNDSGYLTLATLPIYGGEVV